MNKLSEILTAYRLYSSFIDTEQIILHSAAVQLSLDAIYQSHSVQRVLTLQIHTSALIGVNNFCDSKTMERCFSRLHRCLLRVFGNCKMVCLIFFFFYHSFSVLCYVKCERYLGLQVTDGGKIATVVLGNNS